MSDAIAKEKHWLSVYRNQKRPGMHAAVASPNKGKGADRSCVLIRKPDGAWIQAIKCWHGNHAERAAAYVAAFNAAPIVKELEDA